MRPKTMILFVIAVGCGLVASIGVSQYMENGQGMAVETRKIFVAAANINIGEKLDAQNVKLEEWPKDRIPEGAVLNLEEVEDRYPKQRLYPGEPILHAKLMDSNARDSKALTIPEGYRVVAVKVDEKTAVAGLVRPGDRVDLLVYLRKSAEVPETGTRTILRDVNVFSVDGETERSEGEDGQARNVRTVSLLVRPEQAAKLMLAAELGTLSLSLRRPDDKVESGEEGVTIAELLGSEGESANEKDNGPTTGENSDFVNWLKQQNETEEPEIAAVEAVAEPIWRMMIMSPTGLKEFRWQNEGEMPEQVTDEMPASSSDATSERPAVDEVSSPEGQLQVLPDTITIPDELTVNGQDE